MSTTQPIPTDLIPVAEVPRVIPSCRAGRRIALSTVYRWLRSGQLTGYRRGRWHFVSRAEVVGLMVAKGDVPPPVPPVAATWTARVLREAGIG